MVAAEVPLQGTFLHRWRTPRRRLRSSPLRSAGGAVSWRRAAPSGIAAWSPVGRCRGRPPPRGLVGLLCRQPFFPGGALHRWSRRLRPSPPARRDPPPLVVGGRCPDGILPPWHLGLRGWTSPRDLWSLDALVPPPSVYFSLSLSREEKKANRTRVRAPHRLRAPRGSTRFLAAAAVSLFGLPDQRSGLRRPPPVDFAPLPRRRHRLHRLLLPLRPCGMARWPAP